MQTNKNQKYSGEAILMLDRIDVNSKTVKKKKKPQKVYLQRKRDN